jgi:taurine--2-oxoglutarate transaminase
VDKYCFVSPGYGAESRAVLAEKVVSLMPDNIAKVFFTNAGADATRTRLKWRAW